MSDTTTVIVRSSQRLFQTGFEIDPDAKPRGWNVELKGMPVFEGDNDEKATNLHDALVAAGIIQPNKCWLTLVRETDNTQEYTIDKRRR
jgi:hypothetical protein